MIKNFKIEKKNPYIFELSAIGSTELGYITVSEYSNSIPFQIKRVYWIYFTPPNIERGNHAHKELEQIIVSVSGIIEIDLESMHGEKFSFKLDKPNKALYIPKEYWRMIRFSHNAVLLCLASMEYDENDYIRDYNLFKNKR